MIKLTKEEILDLQNNLYKLYLIFKKIKDKNDINLNDMREIVRFYHTFFWNDDYGDEDFTRFCNMEDDIGDYLLYACFDHKCSFEEEEERYYKEKIHEEDIKIAFEAIENISKKYFIFKYLIRLDVNGLVKTGNFKNNDILISNRDNKYVIKLKDKDNNQEQQQFTFNSEKEVEDFFRENDMIVKWEKLEE